MPSHDDLDTCDLCGRRLDAEADDAWLTIEVYRPEHDYIYATFCCQGHAAQWLTKPLPPVRPQVPMTRTMRDRLIDWSLLAFFLGIAGLAALGGFTLVRLLGGWD